MPTTDEGEQSLLEAARTGDERAFGELVGPYRDRLWATCFRITGNREDAEDALQDCLIYTWRSIDRFRGDSRLSTWMFRIATNAALAVVRRRRAPVDELVDVADARRDFTERIADSDRIQSALRLLPEDFRVALVLREFGDFTYDEIAAHQGVLVQTVKTRIHRARGQLRLALQDGEPGTPLIAGV